MNPVTGSAFESRRELPDEALRAQAARLVGFTRRFDRLTGHMRLLADVDGVKRWAERFHTENRDFCADRADKDWNFRAS